MPFRAIEINSDPYYSHDCTNTGSYSTFRIPNQFSPNENKLLTSDDDARGRALELENPLRVSSVARVSSRATARASLMKALCHAFQVTVDGARSFR